MNARVAVLFACLISCGLGCAKRKADPRGPGGFCPPGSVYVGGRPPKAFSEKCMRDGVGEGPYVWYVEPGGQKMAEGIERRGKAVGPSFIWNLDGTLSTRIDRSADGRRERIRHWEVGTEGPPAEGSQLDGLNHGLWRSRQLGQLEILTCYEHDEPLWTVWFNTATTRQPSLYKGKSREAVVPPPTREEIDHLDCPPEAALPPLDAASPP